MHFLEVVVESLNKHFCKRKVKALDMGHYIVTGFLYLANCTLYPGSVYYLDLLYD